MMLLKQIDAYILRNFIKTFAITFFVSIFVLVMQFMFRYADDLIGKGVGVIVLLKFFYYAALTLVPLSLPLSILLGSLMSFGNLGERLELLSMKAAGISLFRIMRPLIILITCISIASFYFADNVLPVTQVKMWTLLFSIREKSPEVDIPEGSFYNGITGRNIYVGRKSNKMLYDLVIYDFSDGFNNTSIIIADTGMMAMSSDKEYLRLTLINGETFENMEHNGGPDNSSNNFKRGRDRNQPDITPFRRESFSRKEILIDFNTNFKEISSDFLDNQYVSKNTTALQHTIDSITVMLDSMQRVYENTVTKETYYDNGLGTKYMTSVDEPFIADDYKPLDAYMRIDSTKQMIAIENTVSLLNTNIGNIRFEASSHDWQIGEIRKHAIEWHRRFSLPFACLIFLFIGAPLGAIIRKGGMGMPIVISTALFIIYYIIDNSGYKMAREGIWPVFYGMWLSAFILLPIGVLFTVLAANDRTVSSSFNPIKAISTHYKTTRGKIHGKLKDKTNKKQ